MVNWLKRKRPVASRTTIVPPGRLTEVERVELAQLTPRIDQYLGHAAVLQLGFFELFARASSEVPELADRQRVLMATQVVLERQLAFVNMLEARGANSIAEMEPFTGQVANFISTVRGGDWLELLVSCYVVTGIIDDCLFHLAGGLPADLEMRVKDLIQGDTPGDTVKDILKREVDENTLVSSRMALWGRRLVGDSLLAARATLDIPENSASDSARLEPVFTELIASHTRRMDDLGLTA